ncbi:unnamed protein product [Rhizopus stolonifer]
MKLIFLFLISAVYALVPNVDFRSPKHIVFSTVGGGSSHNVWVLEILKELHSRNHTVSYFSRGDHLQFAKDYPMVNIYELGGPHDFAKHEIVQKTLRSHLDPMVLPLAAVESTISNYTEEFYHAQYLSKELEVDMFICDSFAIACIDAAITLKKPVMITSTCGIYAGTPESNQLYVGPNPTTANEGVWQRIYRDYIRAPLRIRAIRHRLPQTVQTQRDAGFSFTWDGSSPRYNDLSKIIHNVFGIEIAKSLTPLNHHVGPILRSNYPDLDNVTQRFLDSHQRVVYVGFGQHAPITEQDTQLIMPSLLKLKQDGHIDGIIWARLPHTDHPDILTPFWAPQFAILQHPSTRFFISHGGAGSLIESLYNGVRLLVYPFFGDQPTNARNVKIHGLGDYFDLHDDHPDTFYERLLNVAIDPKGEIQSKVNRYKAYVQISSMNSASKAADLVEENVFACDEEGKLTYRRDIKYDISFVKRHDLDIYFWITLPCVLLYVLYCRSSSLEKLKTE